MTIDESILITSTVLLVISLTTYFMSLMTMIVGIFVKHRWINDIDGYLTCIYLTTGSIFTVLLISWGIINIF